jgi:hypothetical protein
MMSTTFRKFLAIGCTALLVSGDAALMAQEPPKPAPAASGAAAAPATTPAAEEDKPIPPDQLDALVAPIALYPDPLLAQTLVASTYPLEIVQLQQWMAKHKDLKDKALADAVAKEPWDPSIQSMAAFPDVVKRLGDDIQWTTDLGNAFLDQQADVMDAVQRMRTKAKNNGALESNEQQKVEAQVEGGKTVIVVQPTNPEVIYVPSYAPTVVYGPPVYPYPPIYYPPYPPGAAFVSFSFGVMMGAAFWGGSCCGCGWGSSNVNINVNNNFNRVNHYSGGGNNNWNHNPQHRGSAPYGNKATANKYGGGGAGNRGSTAGGRPSAGQQPSRAGGGGAGNRAGSPSASTRPAGGGGGGNRAGSPSAGTRPSSGGGGGSDRIGNRSVPSSSSRASGFGGGSGGFSGSSARASSSRGSRSMGGRPGGGGGGARRR